MDDITLMHAVNKEFIWKKSKLLSYCNQEEINQANLRTQYYNECVLDCDSEITINRILKKLKDEKLSYLFYQYGNQKGHIHLMFDEPLNKEIRKNIIAYFGADIHKQSGLIAYEDKPHWKTGNTKILVEVIGESPNKLRPELKYTVSQEGIDVSSIIKETFFEGISLAEGLNFLKLKHPKKAINVIKERYHSDNKKNITYHAFFRGDVWNLGVYNCSIKIPTKNGLKNYPYHSFEDNPTEAYLIVYIKNLQSSHYKWRRVTESELKEAYNEWIKGNGKKIYKQYFKY